MKKTLLTLAITFGLLSLGHASDRHRRHHHHGHFAPRVYVAPHCGPYYTPPPVYIPPVIIVPDAPVILSPAPVPCYPRPGIHFGITIGPRYYQPAPAPYFVYPQY